MGLGTLSVFATACRRPKSYQIRTEGEGRTFGAWITFQQSWFCLTVKDQSVLEFHVYTRVFFLLLLVTCETSISEKLY